MKKREILEKEKKILLKRSTEVKSGVRVATISIYVVINDVTLAKKGNILS